VYVSSLQLAFCVVISSGCILVLLYRVYGDYNAICFSNGMKPNCIIYVTLLSQLCSLYNGCRIYFRASIIYLCSSSAHLEPYQKWKDSTLKNINNVQCPVHLRGPFARLRLADRNSLPNLGKNFYLIMRIGR
jgi:hypothetical protein